MIQLIFGFLKITVDLKNLSRNSTEKCFELAKQYFRIVKKGLQNSYFIEVCQLDFSKILVFPGLFKGGVRYC
jgi:hypothetical protein